MLPRSCLTVCSINCLLCRELATQLFSVFSAFVKPFSNMRCALLVGGTAVADNEADFLAHGAQVGPPRLCPWQHLTLTCNRHCFAQIVVGTPGRIIDIINRCDSFSLRELEILVLDEADTLLDMGFRQEINTILSLVPKQRRTGLFSATQTKEVKELARAGMRNPVTVAVKVQSAEQSSSAAAGRQQVTPSTLENYYSVCKYDERPGELIRFLNEHKTEKIIVFVATCACVDYYSQCFLQISRRKLLDRVEDEALPALLPADLNVYGLHGKMVPKKRNGIYRKFVEKSSGVLFCTDVAARGVDIPDVDWIVQMAAPKDPAFFVHRVGRTARAGKRGGAVIFVTEEEIAYIELLRGRGIPLVNRTADEGDGDSIHADVLATMKRLNGRDRELLEGSSTAFMSFLRAYKEHQCSFIFRMDSLDIGDVARSYALLRLPKIPETKNRSRIKFAESMDVDTSAVSYLHAEKEAARQRRLVTSLEERRQSLLAAEKEPKKRRVEVVEEQNQEPEKRKRKKKQSYEQKRKEDWDDMAAETALFNKFKKGRITKDEYDDMLFSEQCPAGGSDEDDSGDDGVDHKKRKSRPISANGNVDYRKRRSNKPASSMKGLRKPK